MAKKVEQITYTEARRVLKVNKNKISDAEIARAIALFENLSERLLDNYEKKVFGKTINELTQ